MNLRDALVILEFRLQNGPLYGSCANKVFVGKNKVNMLVSCEACAKQRQEVGSPAEEPRIQKDREENYSSVTRAGCARAPEKLTDGAEVLIIN